ncbi:MAG TPA: SpoIID/LytB domain-containing protein [Firmicutes bacterium]|nr:SpoIID/LytB domain-containing protein [Bacillota bacterium]
MGQIQRRRWKWGAAMTAVAALFLLAGCPSQEDKLLRQFRTEPVIRVEKPGGADRMKLEQYIEGVVAGEIKPGWPLEAYKAQAILARSYALYVLTADGTRPVEAGSITAAHREAQAYAPQNIKPIIRQAVQETRGIVVTYKGKFPQAYFHSASGGWTATASDGGLVEPGKDPPYIAVVESPEDEVAPPEVKRWRATFTAAEVARALAKLGVTARKLEGLEIGRKDPHGRAVTLIFRHDGQRSEVSAPKFRVALSPDRMRSALLTKVAAEGGGVAMEGRGFGHGVGMSQYGAFQMAKHGKKAEEIIKHYYRGVEVKKLWK